jgi:hypothetical protein
VATPQMADSGPDAATWGPGWSPLGTWTIPGATAIHRLDVVCGILGSGKIQGWVDGQLAITLDKPKSLNPVVISGPGLVDGRTVLIYAESPDGGLTVTCDVFVDGRSLVTGEPIGVIPKRASTVKRRLTAYKSVLAQMSNGIWILPVAFIPRALPLLKRPQGGAAFAVFVLVVLGVTAISSLALQRAFKRGVLPPLLGTVFAAAALLFSLTSSLAAVFLALWIAG